jgi:hypothetical protein
VTFSSSLLFFRERAKEQGKKLAEKIKGPVKRLQVWHSKRIKKANLSPPPPLIFTHSYIRDVWVDFLSLSEKTLPL